MSEVDEHKKANSEDSRAGTIVEFRKWAEYKNEADPIKTERVPEGTFEKSLRVISEDAIKLSEIVVEGKRLKEDLCKLIVGILNSTDISIPLSPEILQSPDYEVKNASLGPDGVIKVTLVDSEKKFMQLSDLDNRKVLKLINDMAPKFRMATEIELKTKGEEYSLMNKAVAEFKKVHLALRRDETESGAVGTVKETVNV